MNRRTFLKTVRDASVCMAGASIVPFALSRCAALPGGVRERTPNVVIIFADDLGYGDLACFGHPTIATPHLDRMAADGMRFTEFYTAASVCTPSRAALLTGRIPLRSGMCSDKSRVLFPDSHGGLPASEITLAGLLRDRGYATACVGKWHLGHHPEFLPTRRGFDHYFGIPYSNDMKPCPLMRGEETVELPAVQETLTRRYTEEAVAFIERQKQHPFFLYFAHTFPHVPLSASSAFENQSRRGLYGDVVEELDWSVGRILQSLRDAGIAENTLVIFTSDNGPWLTQKLRGGSAGLLRGGKGSTWEGGMRVPCIAWWPGVIAPGTVCRDMASTLDLFPTAAALARAPIPRDRKLDGEDMTPLLFAEPGWSRDSLFFYRGTRLMAVRHGPWKAHFITQAGYGKGPTAHDPPALYHLERDPSEKFDVADTHPDVIAKILGIVVEHQATLEPAPSQLDDRH